MTVKIMIQCFVVYRLHRMVFVFQERNSSRIKKKLISWAQGASCANEPVKLLNPLQKCLQKNPARLLCKLIEENYYKLWYNLICYVLQNFNYKIVQIGQLPVSSKISNRLWKLQIILLW